MDDNTKFNKPMAGHVEENLHQRTIKTIMESRKNWYLLRFHYNQDRPGGARYEARIAIGEKEEADETAKMAEERFMAFCQECLLNPDGTTMDPQLPVTDMQLAALKNGRVQVANFVNRHMNQLRRMLMGMPTVSKEFLNFFLGNLAVRYELAIFEQCYLIIDNLNIKMPSSHEVKVAFEQVAADHAGRYIINTHDEPAKAAEIMRCSLDIGKAITTIMGGPIQTAIDFLSNTDKSLTTDATQAPAMLH